MAFCSNCGKELDTGVAFCPACGKAVNNRTDQPTSQNNTSKPDANTQSAAQPQSAPATPVQGANPNPNPVPNPNPNPNPVPNPNPNPNPASAPATPPVFNPFAPNTANSQVGTTPTFTPVSPPPSKTNATLALVFGIASLLLPCLCCCASYFAMVGSVVAGILAIVFACLSKKDSGGKMKGMAIAGMVFGIIGIVMAILLVLASIGATALFSTQAGLDNFASWLGNTFGEEFEEQFRDALEQEDFWDQARNLDLRRLPIWQNRLPVPGAVYA